MSRTITKVGAKLDVGLRRTHNEDSLAYRQATNDEEARRRGDLFVVADGMGGHAAGEIASAIAVDHILAWYFSSEPTDIARSLPDAIQSANQLICERAAENDNLKGMGTTCVCSAIRGDKLYTVHVGDSRAYRFRRGNLTRITADHSWVEEQVRRGLLTAAEARSHPMRNVITRALGTAPGVEIDLSVREIQEGDVLLLCSDGLTSAIEDAAIRAVLVAEADPQAVAEALVELANDAGGPDNIAAIAVLIEKAVPVAGSAEEAQERRPGRGWARFLPFP